MGRKHLNRKRDAATMNNDGESPTSSAPRRPKDDEPPVADANAELKWRGDPTESFSDWTIEVVTQKSITDEEDDKTNNEMEEVSEDGDGGKEDEDRKVETIIQTYHVHRIYLACGVRKSDYFSRVFRTSFQESESGTSRIELEKHAADVFPQFLDYLYQGDKELEISVETATALHFLGEYFEVECLRWDARQFIKREMSFENAHIFLGDSGLYCDNSVQGLLSDFLVNNISEVSNIEDSTLTSISKELDQDLLFDVLSRIDSQDPRSSQDASALVASFAERHHTSLDCSTFLKLTDRRTLPHIDHRSALLLLINEDRICTTDSDSEDDKDLSSLQERCATAIADQFKSVLGWAETDDTTLRELEEQKPAFLIDLLIKSWKVAKKSEKALQAKLDSALVIVASRRR